MADAVWSCPSGSPDAWQRRYAKEFGAGRLLMFCFSLTNAAGYERLWRIGSGTARIAATRNLKTERLGPFRLFLFDCCSPFR